MNNDFVFDIHKNKQYTYEDIVLEHINQEIIQIVAYDDSLSSNTDLPTFLFSLIYRKRKNVENRKYSKKLMSLLNVGSFEKFLQEQKVIFRICVFNLVQIKSKNKAS